MRFPRLPVKDDSGYCEHCGYHIDDRCECDPCEVERCSHDAHCDECGEGLDKATDSGLCVKCESFPSLLESAEQQRHVDLVFPLMLEDLKLFEQCVARHARKPHRCNSGRSYAQELRGGDIVVRHRVSCAVPIQSGERYIEFFGESPAYSSGKRYHIECARQEGLVL